MKNELRNALNKVRAGDALKRKTSEFLRAEAARRNRAVFRFHPAFAAVFVTLITIGVFTIYLTPTAHIDIDVNPSVGLALNRFGIVIEAVAYNADGSDVLQSVGVKNKTYKEAAKTLMSEFISGGYLTNNGLVSATVHVSNESDENRLIYALTDVVNLALSERRISAETDLFSVNADVMNAAHGHHMTPAKYLAIEELLEVDPTATFENSAENSVGEIRSRIAVCTGEGHGGADNGHHDDCEEELDTEPHHQDCQRRGMENGD